MIQINSTYLPPREELDKYLDAIYQDRVVTNNGPLVQKFEHELRKLMNVNHLLYVNSGHTAIMMTLNSLPKKGKIILSAFSFASSLNATLWNGHQPIFADITQKNLAIEPNQVEDILKKENNIQAILATHLFGNICDVKALKYISEKYEVPVIYDAAHSVGIKYEGKSLFQHGDMSAISFHAYKSLNSVEGGAIITQNKDMHETLFNMRYFGIDMEDKLVSIGLNGKNSEIHAAFGLCNIKSWHERLLARQQTHNLYLEKLSGLPLTLPAYPQELESNYSYFPIIVESEKKRNALSIYLETQGIKTKKYFHPVLNQASYLNIPKVEMPISEFIAERILCIPIHADLTSSEVNYIIGSILQFEF